ncbi:sulfatase-like hydrolase/transferase [Rubritalea tangerina]|uniref:Sulfatase-like hydrolase/transferase n=1 Tax=Rubritalea tangerina TaxID=430798 RepID=A0ABW4Z9B4_9BACT
MHHKLFTTLLCILPLYTANALELQINAAANTTNAGNQGTSSLGTLTCSTPVADNSAATAPGQIQQFTISNIDVNNNGGNNDNVIITFRITGSGNVQTNTSGSGWLSPGSNALSNNGQSLTISFESIQVNLDGGTNNGSASFQGFSAVTMGNWDNASDTATINGQQFTYNNIVNETLTLSNQNQNSLTFSYQTASGDSGSWRPLGTHFSINIESNDQPPHVTKFSSNDLAINPGQTITLSWQVENADSVTISPDIGDVTWLTQNGVGSTTVTLTEATTFTLTATNSDGETTHDAPIHLRPSKPNIIVFLIDDWGTEDCSVNFNLDANHSPIPQIDPTTVGLPAFTQTNNHFHTPTLEKLAASGTIFTRAYVSPMCSPTRVTFMTGQNTARHKTTNYLGGGGKSFNIKSRPNLELTAPNRTIAEVLRDAGYRTMIVGKGHIGDENLDSNHYKEPAANPADDFYGFQINVAATGKGQHRNCYSNASPAFNINGSSASEDAFVAEYQNKTYADIDPQKYANEPWKDEPLYVTEALTLEINERIEDAVKLGKPFFAYFSHYATHQPHQIDPRFQNNPKYAGLSGNILDLATMVEGVDQSTADVIAKLESLGVADDTLIVFFGDNGSEADPRPGDNPTTLGMSNPLRGQKGHRHEGGTRVPFIVSWAQLNATNTHQVAFPIQAGNKQHDIIAAQDIFPTLCAAANVPLPNTDDAGQPLTIDGHNLAGYLAGTPGSHRPQQLLIHSPTPHAHDFFTILHQGPWKLIYNYNSSVESNKVEQALGSYELFHLTDDPYEADNRASASSPNYNPTRLMQMARELIAEIDRHGGEHPFLINQDPALAALGLPAQANDPHPIILPLLPGIDSDADDLDDNQEDPNRNGKVDNGETDPNNQNTDGDSTPDGAESKLGTDPLDPSSAFHSSTTLTPQGALSLTWPSLPSTSFTIRSSPDLIDWSNIITTGISAEDAATSTSFPLPAPNAAQCFYRVELE